MTQAQRPDNPFAAAGVGARYALGRPYHHPRALARSLRHARRDTRSNARSTSRAAPGCRPARCTRSPTSWSASIVRPRCSQSPRRVAAGADFVRSAAETAAVRRSRRSTRSPCARACTGSTSRGSSPKRAGCSGPTAGSRCTTTTSSARWSTSPSSRSGRGSRSSVIRCPPRNPQVGDPRAETPDRLREGRRRVLRRRHRHDAAAVRRLPAVDQQLRRRRANGARLATSCARGCSRRPRRSTTSVEHADRAVPRLGHLPHASTPAVAGAAACRRAPRDLVDDAELAGELRGRQLGRARSRGARRATAAAARRPATTYATTRSPHSSSAAPTTQTSRDVGVVREHAFDLGRAHVDAAGDDEVLLAVDDAHGRPSSISPTSPVASQPSASSTVAVCAGSRR